MRTSDWLPWGMRLFAVFARAFLFKAMHPDVVFVGPAMTMIRE